MRRPQRDRWLRADAASRIQPGLSRIRFEDAAEGGGRLSAISVDGWASLVRQSVCRPVCSRQCIEVMDDVLFWAAFWGFGGHAC